MTTTAFPPPPLWQVVLRADHYCSQDAAKVVHAVANQTVARNRDEPRAPLQAVCGVEASLLWQIHEARAYQRGWPCRVVGVHARCSTCHDLTGRKRPHGDWPAR